MAMTSGKADPQQLYMGGKLKIAGNVMASMKLGFLKKLDMNAAKAAIAAHRARAPPRRPPRPHRRRRRSRRPPRSPIASPASSPPPSRRPVTLQLRVREPDSAWAITLGPQGGSITAGEATSPARPSPSPTTTSPRWPAGRRPPRRCTSAASCASTATPAAHHLSLVEGVL
jgi:3-hydroxyacyl-CoA dehydrogenase/3a,7a,12a-trihydroxy-5b-cholest-24-enoyl-CoA hydratase